MTLAEFCWIIATVWVLFYIAALYMEHKLSNTLDKED